AAVTDRPRVRAYAGLLLGVAAVAGLLVAPNGLPRSTTFLALAAAAIWLQHRDVIFHTEVAIDGGIAVVTAAALTLRHDRLIGTLLVGALGGLLLVPHLRARAWSRIAYNTGNFGLSALAGAAAVSALDPGSGVAATLATALVCGLAYWSVNDLLGLVL